MSKVTIVVPVYNVEEYIAKCLDSFVVQANEDFEVLVVNDGSPKNEQVIIDEYVKKYPFIHTIVKENGGYGSVLELAVKTVTTPYMLVCDPDDYLRDDAVKTLLDLIEKNDCDIAIGAKTLIYADSEEQNYDPSFNTGYVLLEDGKVFERDSDDYEQLYFVDPSPHAKLYKVSLLKETQFPHKVSFTDNILFFTALNRAKRVVYTREPLAYYLINRVGNTMTDVKPTAIDAEIKVLNSLITQCRGEDVPEMFYYRMFEAYKFIMNDKINRCNGTKEEVRQRLLSLYTVISNLLDKGKQIQKYYRKYATYHLVERTKDLLLLQPKTSQKTYLSIVNKKIENLK